MKHTFNASYADIAIRPLEEGDIELLRIWRNDPEKTKYLRKLPEITPQMQKTWFEASQQNQDELVFAVVETKKLNRMVGSVALYSFQENVAEVGRLQIGDPEAAGRGIGRVAMSLAVWIGFTHLGLEKLKAEVHCDNIAACKSYYRMGFRKVGTHDGPVGPEYDLEITRKDLETSGFLAEQVMEQVL